MRLRSLSFKNWRNFKSADVTVADRLFIVGPNASGKSNMPDGLRFLHDIADTGGGLQHAVGVRGGLGRIRCLGRVQPQQRPGGLEIRLHDPDREVAWIYELHPKAGPDGRPVVDEEMVWKDDRVVLERAGRG